MAQLGVNVAGGGWIPVSVLSDLGVRVVRIVAYPSINDFGYLEQLRQAGIRRWLVLASESFSGFPSWGAAIDEYNRRYGGHIDVWQLGNEPDQPGPSSWSMSPQDFTGLLWTGRDRLPGKYLVAGGLHSGNPSWLNNVNLDWVNGIAVHPYGQLPPGQYDPSWYFGHVNNLLNNYRNYLNSSGRGDKHMHVSEWGGPVQDWDWDENRHGAYIGYMSKFFRGTSLVGDSIMFCAHDSMVSQFGLMRSDWSKRPAWHEYQATCRGWW
ncbi:hypothetical protein [Archangium sp.]|uniref:hypothetical protein n=1 Tax=Archangium sp. TaxID=1872627 RepID=UPI002D658AF5|nr:hypothetical protein [Archangium sp.]HYO55740.1 hypothetical protein [Archangium sp.]